MGAYMNALHEEGTKEDLIKEVERLLKENSELRATAAGIIGKTPHPAQPTTEHVLLERAATHGNYHHQAALAAALKRHLRAEPHYDKLLLQHQDALDMIITKISRIIWGNPNHRDHWDDIAGYAVLASKECLKP